MNPDQTSRRKFIATSGATAAMMSFPNVLRAQNAKNNETLKIGLIGCGGRSSKISVKAAKVGFEWENIEGVWDKFSEELAEFKESLATDDKAHQQSELGDLIFTIINLARWYDLDASAALSGTNERFIQRLSKMENFADRPLTDYSLQELENLWQKAKKELSQ